MSGFDPTPTNWEVLTHLAASLSADEAMWLLPEDHQWISAYVLPAGSQPADFAPDELKAYQKASFQALVVEPHTLRK